MPLTNILFIDSLVADREVLIQAAAPGTKVVVLDSTQDGITQMAHALQGVVSTEGKGSVGAISIVSHGDSGVLVLGSTVLSTGNLAHYTEQLKAIGSAVAAGGDIQLYGCDVGAGSTGLTFINMLAQATGTGVAASSNATGGTAAGGDWNLEVTSGNAEAPTVLDTAALAGYGHTLHTVSVGSFAALQSAVTTAGALADSVDDVITLTQNITLTAGQTLAINVLDGHTLTIVGGGFALSGGNVTQVMTVNSSNAGSAVVLQNLTIQNGFLAGGGGNSDTSASEGLPGGAALGAGIYNQGNLTLIGSTVTANKAAGGGGGGGDQSSAGGSGGGGGGGFGSTLGASGGSAGNGGIVSATPATAGMGGSGGGSGGIGGSTVGGAGSSSSSTNGGNGGSGSSGTILIGGGGGGAGYDASGGAGGNAVAGIYNTSPGVLTVLNSTISNNVAAGGGGGGGNQAASATGGTGGSAAGAIWNQSGTVRLDAASFAALAGNAAAAGIGGSSNGSTDASGTASNNIGGNGTPVTNFVRTTVTSVSASTADGSYKAGSTIAITVGFSGTVQVAGGTPVLALGTGTTLRNATYANGTNSASLVFNYVVQAGDTAADLDYTGTAALSLAGGRITGQAIAADLTLATPGTTGSLGAAKNIVIDTTAPVLASAAVNGASLVMSFTDTNNLDAVNKAANSAYTVLVGGVADVVTATAVDAVAKTVTLTLATAATGGQTVTVAYADPTGGDDANAVQDAAGNDLATLTAQAVTNNTAGAPAPAPAPSPSPAPAPAPGVIATAPAAGGTVQGSAGNDTLTGLGGNDRFVLGGGTDTVDGGAGLNTVVEAGTRAQYTLSHTADGTFTVKGVDGSVATLQNIQRISFGDVTIALDTTPATGRVTVLYQMALGRNPEGNGLDYYLAQSGTASTLQKAQGFVASAEFAGRYGSLTDSAFITQMYTNAFGRAPDAGGMAFYLDALSHTTPLEGRAGLLAGFLDSAEMGVKLVGLVDQGVPLLAG